METIKRELHEIWKEKYGSKNIWKVQMPKGIWTCKTKKHAIQVAELGKQIMENNAKVKTAEKTISTEPINQKDYRFYLVINKNRIHSGWEYREDAKDAFDDLPEDQREVASIYQNAGLKKFNLDASNNDHWATN